MRFKYLVNLAFIIFGIASPVFADFGDADFPIDLFKNSPKSYHDVWCREIEKECRVRLSLNM